MFRTFALMGMTLAAGLLLAQPASAGGPTSAPTKYSGQSRQVTVAQHARQPKVDYPITEYSSSSAKITSLKR